MQVKQMMAEEDEVVEEEDLTTEEVAAEVTQDHITKIEIRRENGNRQSKFI